MFISYSSYKLTRVSPSQFACAAVGIPEWRTLGNIVESGFRRLIDFTVGVFQADFGRMANRTQLSMKESIQSPSIAGWSLNIRKIATISATGSTEQGARKAMLTSIKQSVIRIAFV